MPLPQPKTNTFFGNSVLIFLSRFFPSLASLLVILWYAKVLPVATYGQYGNFWIMVSVFYPILCFGLHVLVVTYSKEFIFQLAGKLKASYYALYTLWLLVLSTVFALLQNYLCGIGFWVPFLFILAYAVAYILESFLTVFKSYTILILLNVIYSVGYVAVHWYVFNSGFNLLTLFAGLLIFSALKIVAYTVTVIHTAKQQPVLSAPPLPIAIHSIRSLWLHLGFYDIIQSLTTWIDKFIVSLVLTAAASAVYFNGSMNIPFLPIILSAASSAVLIQLAAGKKYDENTDAVKLMNQSGRILSSIVFPLFFFLLFFSKELIGLLLPKYLNAYPIFILALMILPLRAYSFTTVLQRMHKGAIINAGAVGDIILAVLLMYPLYQWLGLPGIALAFVVSSYLQAAFYLFYSARLLQASMFSLLPFANWIAKLIVFGLLFIGIHYMANAYFTAKIVLFLGGAVMGVAVLLSLGMELKKQGSTNHGNKQQA